MNERAQIFYTSQIYQMYAKFDVKCCGKYRLANTLQDGVQIQTPETMDWFIRCCGDALHPATTSFDIMESKWDTLAASLDVETYQKLFTDCLGEDMNAAQLQERLDRYRALTPKDYLTWYSENAYIDKFSRQALSTCGRRFKAACPKMAPYPSPSCCSTSKSIAAVSRQSRRLSF